MKAVFVLLLLLNLTATLVSLFVEPLVPLPKQEKPNLVHNQQPTKTIENENIKGEPVVENPPKKKVNDNLVEVNSGNIHQKKIDNINSKVNSNHDTSSKTLNNQPSVETKTTKNVPWSNDVQQESSILTKGMMLLLTISLLFMMFVAYKTYRRKSRYARIRKYGVRLTKGNIEMRPLPLDNDDEDETIFDLKNVPT